jgi:hypothetical protein
MVMDVAMTWHRQQSEQAQAKSEGRSASTSIPVNKLQEMMDRVKNK